MINSRWIKDCVAGLRRCRVCKGSGKWGEENFPKCPECLGTGRRMYIPDIDIEEALTAAEHLGQDAGRLKEIVSQANEQVERPQ